MSSFLDDIIRFIMLNALSWTVICFLTVCLSMSSSFVLKPLYSKKYDPFHSLKYHISSLQRCKVSIDINSAIFAENIDSSQYIITKSSPKDRYVNFMKNLWDFSRPHTLIGSGLSLLSLYTYASPLSYWFTKEFLYSFMFALIPSLAMNIYITGLNQLTDVDIDKINKPYLPIASGKLSNRSGTIIVLMSLLLSLLFSIKADSYLRLTLLGSGLLGTLYSLPPFRLKRYPLLAAFCILVVRGSLVNLGFYFSSKVSVQGESVPSLLAGIARYPESAFITMFFATFGVVIALMKDVPDVAGDVVGEIPSFSVQLGPKKMLRLARILLFALLAGTGSSMLAIAISKISSLPRSLVLYRAVVGISLIAVSLDARQRGKAIDAHHDTAVFDYYMYIWKIFYACYVALPFIR